MRGLRGAIAIASVFAASLAGATGAGATTYVPAGTLASGAGLPGAVAVDQSNGNVYVAEFFDPSFGPGTILRFDASGDPLTPASMGEPDAYSGVAVSPLAGHDVFAASGGSALGGSESIFGFDSAGTALGAPFPFPTGVEGFTPQVASSSAGNVLVVGSVESKGVVIEYDAESGAELQTIDCSACPAPASFDTGASAAAVDSAGNIYVADSSHLRVVKFGPEGDADPVAPVVFSTGSSVGIAVNPSNGHVFTTDGVTPELHIIEYDSAGAPVSDFGQGELGSEAPMLAVNASTGVVYASEGAAEKVRIFAPVGPPTATTDPASALSTAAATLNGTANPHSSGAITSCEFEWGTDTSYAETPVPCSENPADGYGDVTVKGSLAGLAPDTTYHYRLAIESAGGTDTGDDATFTTSAIAPAATTEAATAIGQSASTLHGSVDAEGNGAQCKFEYGTTAGYGKSAPCSPAEVTGTAPAPVSAALTGLTAATTYHYRVVATNKGGPAEGDDMTFTTLADTCATNAALCPPPPPPVVTPPVSTPPVTTPPVTKKPPLKCKKGFKKKKVKGKAKCVKVKKKHKKK